MDFDNRKVYGDTFISDGLVFCMYCEIHFLIFIHFLVELLPPRGELLLGHTRHAEPLEVGHVLLLPDVDAAGKHGVSDEVPNPLSTVEKRDCLFYHLYFRKIDAGLSRVDEK